MVTAGIGCSSGAGNACVISSSSSSQADAEQRGDRDHRVEAASGDRLFQVIDQNLLIDHLAGQVPVHQAFVFALLDDRLDQRAAGLGQPVQVAGVGVALGALAARVLEVALGEQADQPVDRALAVADRQVERRDRVAEGGAAGVERLVEAAALMVELGDDDRARRARARALVPQHRGQAVDAVGGRHGEQAASAARSPARRSPMKSA